MAARRSYADRCGVARALDVVGERWALLVVRELLLGPKRFTDLRDGLPNASPNVLAQRLRDLEDGAIVQRRKLPPPAGSSVYELTDWGRELKPVIISLGTWAIRSPPWLNTMTPSLPGPPPHAHQRLPSTSRRKPSATPVPGAMLMKVLPLASLVPSAATS